MACLRKEHRTWTFQFGNAPGHPLDDCELLQLFEALEAFGKDGADVLVITGSGTTFSKGFDLDRMRSITDGEELGRCLEQANHVVNRLAACPKLTVAAINGHCLGGGLEVAMACRFRLCSTKARLGLPEIWSGILPGMGGIHRLVELVGEAKALEMITLGDLITADQALAAGLVHRVCAADRFEEEVGAFIRGIQTADQTLLREALRLVRSASRLSPEDHAREVSAVFAGLAPWVKAPPSWIEPLPAGLRAEDDVIGVCMAHAGRLPADFAETALTPGEKLEFDGLSNTGRRQEWLAARAALKWLLLKAGIIRTWKDADISKAESGKPYIRLGGDGKLLSLDCSLSHKDGYAIAALARAPGIGIGVDIETRSPRPAQIRSVFGHPSDSLQGVENPELRFSILWTLKEAAAKALGSGVGSLAGLVCRGAAGSAACQIVREADRREVKAVYGAAGPHVVSLAWTQLPVEEGVDSVHSIRRC